MLNWPWLLVLNFHFIGIFPFDSILKSLELFLFQLFFFNGFDNNIDCLNSLSLFCRYMDIVFIEAIANGLCSAVIDLQLLTNFQV